MQTARKKLITATSPIADSHVSQSPTNQAVINQMLESRLDKPDRILFRCHHSPRQPVDNHRYDRKVFYNHRKVFYINFTTHQDHIFIDRLKPAIFSMESLNEAVQAPFPHFSCSDEDHRPTRSCSPAHTNESLDDDICQNNPEHRYTSRGRRIHTPTRFKDYELA